MNLRSLESRVRSLRKKLTKARAQRVIHPMVDDHCLEWARAKADLKPIPENRSLMLRIVNAGYKLLTLTAGHFYLDRCRRRDTIPEPRLLIPRPSFPAACPSQTPNASPGTSPSEQAKFQFRACPHENWGGFVPGPNRHSRESGNPSAPTQPSQSATDYKTPVSVGNGLQYIGNPNPLPSDG